MEPRNGQDGQNGHNESQTNGCNYSNLFPEQWTHLAMIGAGNPNKNLYDESSTSSPAQPSHHEWSGSDSKDGNDGPYGSPRSISSNGMSEESRLRSNSISSANKSNLYMNSEAHESALFHSSRQINAFHMSRPLKMGSASASSPHNDEHNSNAEECYYRIDSPMKGNLTANMSAIGSIGNSSANYNKIRRVDSPTDSGIESGKEHGNGSTPTTSVCSSPRSAMDDKVKDVSDSESSEKHESIDDMPMLKRALQAPPLVNTNKLMDEAYRHHKKFRAAQRKDEPHSPSTTTTSPSHSIQESFGHISQHSTQDSGAAIQVHERASAEANRFDPQHNHAQRGRLCPHLYAHQLEVSQWPERTLHVSQCTQWTQRVSHESQLDHQLERCPQRWDDRRCRAVDAVGRPAVQGSGCMSARPLHSLCVFVTVVSILFSTRLDQLFGAIG